MLWWVGVITVEPPGPDRPLCAHLGSTVPAVCEPACQCPVHSADEQPPSQLTETFSSRCYAVCGAAVATGRTRDLGKADVQRTKSTTSTHKQPTRLQRHFCSIAYVHFLSSSAVLSLLVNTCMLLFC